MSYNIKKTLVVISLIIVITLTAGFGSTQQQQKDIRVALILEGVIADKSWNEAAFRGLEKIAALGAETHYVENVPLAAIENTIRVVSNDGYDVVFLASSSYVGALQNVAKEFPDTQFFIMNANFNLDNVRSFAINDEEQGFLMGILAASLTETNKVGFAGGEPIVPIQNGEKGFRQGVANINQNAAVYSFNTIRFDAVDQAQMLSEGLIELGVDVIAPMANLASLGAIYAANKTDNVKIIASSLSQKQDDANNSIAAVVVKDTSVAYEVVYKSYLENNVADETLRLGIKDGVIYISDYAPSVSEEIIEKVNRIYEDIKSNEIIISLE